MNPNNQEITAPRAYLVESIPKGLEDLRGTPGVQYTEEVLVRLTRAARSTIDLTAMYWALLPDPEGDDEKGFTEEEFEKMGAGAGRLLYEALRDAAARGVPFFEAIFDIFARLLAAFRKMNLNRELPARAVGRMAAAMACLFVDFPV
jgi:hypothetical protein